MGYLKRGVLVFVVLLLLFFIPLGFGEGEDDGSGTPVDGLPEPTGELQQAEPFAEIRVSYNDGGPCNDVSLPIHIDQLPQRCLSPPAKGCRLRNENYDWGNAYACAEIVPGLIITQEPQENLFCGEGSYNRYENPLHPGIVVNEFSDLFCPHIVGGNVVGNLKCKNGYVGIENSQYLCSDDTWWYRCSVDDENKVAWVDNVLYECVINEAGGVDRPEWVAIPGTDVDRDGFSTSEGDCDDNPEGDSSDCPTDLTEEECRYPTNSLCAACINPSSPEICGDTINNDCGGPDGRESRTELTGNTPDDCNKFAAGCEQKSLKDLNPALSDEPENLLPHNNIYDTPFSWTETDTDDGGYCCGYNGIEDLGKKKTDPDDNERICLNKNTELVGREGEILNCDGAGDTDGGTNGWCWATAADQNNAFHILTIKKPTEPAYDVVSNNNDWIECKDGEGTKGISAAGSILDPTDVPKANRFYCYKEGNRWSWAELKI